ncbi:helix-turn-helix domain-containing protein [Brevundimonas sp.]|uniref:helix-turn-helix domain-containing protein n=1 Tax=Brevundimonas sp. TaxID=1871086 RepID=UPI0035218C58
MGQAYEQFTLEDRCEIARRREAGETIRAIAAALGRSPSSVSRELRRNGAARGERRPHEKGRWAGNPRRSGVEERAAEPPGRTVRKAPTRPPEAMSARRQQRRWS